MKRKFVLQETFNCFVQMVQWVATSPDYYSKYYNKAETLIELLEVNDCGQVGGFDKKNPVKWGESKLPLYDRFLALLRKENTKLKKESYFTPYLMKQYLLHISEEKDNWYNKHF